MALKPPSDKEIMEKVSGSMTMPKTEILRHLDKGLKMKVALCWFGDELIEMYHKRIKPKTLVRSIDSEAEGMVKQELVDPKEKDKAVISAANKQVAKIMGKLDPMPKRLRGVVELTRERNVDGTPNPAGQEIYLYSLNKLEGEPQYVKALKERLKPGIPIVFEVAGDDVGEEDESDAAAEAAAPVQPPTSTAQPADAQPPTSAAQPAAAQPQQATAAVAMKASVANTYATVWTRTHATVAEQLAAFGKEVEDAYKGQPFASEIAGAYKSKVLDPILKTLDLTLVDNMTAIAGTEADPTAQATKVAEARETVKRYQAAMNAGPVAALFAELNENNPWRQIKLGPAIIKILSDVDGALSPKTGGGAAAQPS